MVHVGCCRNVSPDWKRPRNGESKTATSVVLSAWQWESRMGGGAEVSHGEEEVKPKFSLGVRVWESFKDSAFSEGRKRLSRRDRS